MENHDEAYYVWREAGFRNLPLVHVDPHHDMWPISKDGPITVGNYVFRAIKDGIVSEVYWVVPDDSFDPGNVGELCEHLRQLPPIKRLTVSDRRIDAEYLGRRLVVCTAKSLPSFQQPVLLDIDVDYFVLPYVSAPQAHEIPDGPWTWPEDFLDALPSIQVAILTIAYSVNGGTTPLRWKYLGEELLARLLNEERRLEYFSALRTASIAGLDQRQALLATAIQSDPGHPAAHFHLSETLEKIGDFESARSEYARAISADETYLTPYNSFGPVLEAAGRGSEAADEYQRILRIAPDDADALCGAGRVAAALADWDSAARLAERALSSRPNSIEATRLKGDAGFALGQFAVAARSYGSYLALLEDGQRSLVTSISSRDHGEDFHEVRVRSRLAKILVSIGQPEAAERQYRWLSGRFVANTPMASICLSHAKVLAKLGRFGDAATKCGHAAAVLPLDTWRAARKFSRTSTRSPVRDAGLNMARMIVATLGGVVTSAIMARSLGVKDMGVYGYALWITGLMAGICHFGLPTALAKFIAGQKGKGEAGYTGNIVRAILKIQAAIISLVMLGGVVIVLLGNHASLWILPVLLVAPMAMQQAFTNALMGAGEYATLTRDSALATLLQLFLVVAVALAHGGIVWFLTAALIANVSSALLYLMSLNDAGLLVQPINKPSPGLGRIFLFSGPVAYLVFLDLIVWQRSEIWFLREYSIWQELAFYSIAYLIVGRLTEVLVSVSSTLLPMQASIVAREGKRAAGDSQMATLCWMQALLLPACALVALFAKPMVHWVYGPQYLRVWTVLVLLLLSPIAVTMTDVSVASLYALDKQRSLLAPLTMTALFNIALAYLLVPRWGAMGAATANSMAQLSEGLFLLFFSASVLSVAIPWGRLAKIYGAAIISFGPAAVAVAMDVRLFLLCGIAAVGGISYLLILLSWGELDPAVVSGSLGVANANS